MLSIQFTAIFFYSKVNLIFIFQIIFILKIFVGAIFSEYIYTIILVNEKY